MLRCSAKNKPIPQKNLMLNQLNRARTLVQEVNLTSQNEPGSFRPKQRGHNALNTLVESDLRLTIDYPWCMDGQGPPYNEASTKLVMHTDRFNGHLVNFPKPTRTIEDNSAHHSCPGTIMIHSEQHYDPRWKMDSLRQYEPVEKKLYPSGRCCCVCGGTLVALSTVSC